ncbi:MAG: CDP-alcohol phosphatidyltransferase family protein [Clostridia bacterium]|nr:CDP-alcohol phosphatidyltransferase family protein [Clostridia bacterium]
MKWIANIVTVIRIIIAPIILFAELFSFGFYTLYILCGVTDMADGFIARRTHSESKVGELLDSIADLIFIVVCMIKILPIVSIWLWLWIWIAVIALIRVINLILGYIYQRKLLFLHTTFNKITGILLFMLPLTITFLNINHFAIIVSAVATFAAVQEGYHMREI